MFRSSCAVPVWFTNANKDTLWPTLLSIWILNHRLLSHLSFLKQKKEDFFLTEYADRTREKRKFELKNTFAVHGIVLSFVNKHLHLNSK